MKKVVFICLLGSMISMPALAEIEYEYPPYRLNKNPVVRPQQAEMRIAEYSNITPCNNQQGCSTRPQNVAVFQGSDFSPRDVIYGKAGFTYNSKTGKYEHNSYRTF